MAVRAGAAAAAMARAGSAGGRAKAAAAAADGRGSKRSKWAPSKPGTSTAAIPSGSRGILVTYDHHWEPKAHREALALIEEHWDKLAGTTEGAAAGSGGAGGSASGGGSGGGTNVAAMLAAEVAELRRSSGASHRFKIHDTRVKGCCYVPFPSTASDPVSTSGGQGDGGDDDGGADADGGRRADGGGAACGSAGAAAGGAAAGPSPQAVVLSVLREARDGGAVRAPHCQRLLPVTAACFNSLEDIAAAAPALLRDEFPEGAGVEGIPFAVEYEHRDAPKLDRMDVINAFADRIKAPHKVSLKDPVKTIIVQRTRNAVGMSVVTHYKELSKYNLHKAAEPPEEAAAAGAATATAASGAGAEAGGRAAEE